MQAWLTRPRPAAAAVVGEVVWVARTLIWGDLPGTLGMRTFVLLGVLVWALILLAAWIGRDLMALPWWVVSGVVFGLLHRLTSHANAENPLDRPPNPVPLRVVNTIAGNAAVLSFAAAIFSLLFR